MSDPVELAIELIRRRSVTPDDAGCQVALAGRLEQCGFRSEWLNQGEVSNLLCTMGEGQPSLWFVGHTDVVPPGPDEAWTSPPFEPEIRDAQLYGRGAADMKGAVAAMVVAAERWAATGGGTGQLGILLTSDEEGEAIDGIRHVARVLADRGEAPDYCLVGEPSSRDRLGDVLRIGRRGSMHLRLRVPGVQGHTAFPALLDNPVHGMAGFLAELVDQEWDEGDGQFPPTHCQVSYLQAGTGAENVTPAHADLQVNFRNGPASPAMNIQARVQALLEKHGLHDAEANWFVSGDPFVSEPGPLTDAVVDRIRDLLDVEPERNTGGGTSDGRFLAPLGCEIIEFGVRNATIHQVDEHAAVADIEALSEAYLAIIHKLLGED